MLRTSRAVLFLLIAALVVAVTLSFVEPVFAQAPASLEIAVVDPSQAPIGDARVSLQDLASPSAPRDAMSAGQGRYRLDAPPGRYRLTIAHNSFIRSEQELTLAAGERRELNISMRLQPLSEQVSVSADAWPIPTATASESVTILVREEMDRRQTTQLPALLATQAGFTISQSDSFGGVTSLFLDGGNSNSTKVILDGITLNQPGGSMDFSNITLDNIDKVEIVRGAQSALVGSDAMTGTVELLTHRGSTRLPLLRLDGEGGSFATGRGSGRVSGLAGPLDYSAAAGYFSAAGLEPNNRFINRALSGNFGLRFAEDHSLRLTLRNNTSDAGIPGQTVFTPPNLDQHNALQNFAAGLVWQFSTGSRWQHQIRGSESYIDQLFENQLSDFFSDPDPFGSCSLPRSADAVPSVYCDFTYRVPNQFNRAGFDAQTTYLVRQGSITAGYAYEVENASLNALGGTHVRRNNQAGFLAGRWQLVPRLVVNAGFRVEDNDNFGTRVVPRAGASYTLRDGGEAIGTTQVRFTYGEGIKEPRLDQSFGTDICNPGNPDLRPEQSRTFHAGVEQGFAGERVRASAEYFDGRFEDIVSFTFCFPGGPCPVVPPSGCPFGFGNYFNTDLARSRGTIVSLDAELARWLQVAGNYTYNDTRVLESPNAFDPAQAPGNRLLRRPLHSGNIVISSFWGRFGGTFTGRFSGRRTDSDFLFPPVGLTSNPGYAVFDLAGNARISRQVTFTARLENLFDKQYQPVLGYPAPGIGFYAGLRLEFGGE
jgi:outer membrane cobalamin receptor